MASRFAKPGHDNRRGEAENRQARAVPRNRGHGIFQEAPSWPSTRAFRRASTHGR